jgi:alginate O-acetyltransferase complex protein AlgI
LRDFVYVPLGFGHPGPLRRAANLMITMVLGGIWHGAGWTYVAWGAYHGFLLVCTFAWQSLRGPGRAGMVAQFLGWAWTFTAFAVGLAFFRAADIATSWRLLFAMTGLSNPSVDKQATLAWDNWLIYHDYVSAATVTAWLGNSWSIVGTIMTIAAIAIMLLVPDTMELVDYREGDTPSKWRRSLGAWSWRPSYFWLGATSALFVAAFTSINRLSEFLYYQF